MCGIAGIVSLGRTRLDDLGPRVDTMTCVQHTRGPDDRGAFSSPDGRVALGNCRLAIRDLSAAGHMPMSAANGSVWITYNGEIYNADQLRSELEREGVAFQSHSDTEIVLNGYIRWGEKVVKRLRGMFAFGIYDARAEPRIVLARDPLGIKPLYYAHVGQTFCFASECQAVIASGLTGREISPVALVAYLQLGSVPAPFAIYKDIKALEAGHLLSFTLGERPGAPEAYWSLPDAQPAGASSPEYHELVEQVRLLLRDSVRRHLVSDVPLGVFLSGGIDSASIVAFIRDVEPSATIRTCSVVFDESTYSEADYAHSVADRFHTEHCEVPVRWTDVGEELERVLAALDQPSTDGINTYFVSRAARQASLTVALSGLGGDELFGGYPSFTRLGGLVRGASIAGKFGYLSQAAAHGLRTWNAHHRAVRLADWVMDYGASPTAAYLGMRGLFGATVLESIVRPEVLADVRRSLDLAELIERRAHLDASMGAAQIATRLELTCYMRHQLLRDADVMSMANSLEVRVPFVDSELVSKVLPWSVVSPRGSVPKQLLRDATPVLPSMVRHRREKQGFTFPFKPWLSGPLRPKLKDLVCTAEQHMRDYLLPGSGTTLLAAFEDGRAHWTHPWAIAALCSTLPPATPAK